MSTATWGEPDSQIDDIYSSLLLRHLLYQMMMQFSAQGACIALYDESLKQMVVRLHVQLRNPHMLIGRNGVLHEDGFVSPRRSRDSGALPSLAVSPLRSAKQLAEVLVDITPRQSQLFPAGGAFPRAQDLIGYVWAKHEAYIMRHEDYLSFFHGHDPDPLESNFTPSWYLVVPIEEVPFMDTSYDQVPRSDIIGVVVLYQLETGPGFQQKQRLEALHFTERMALYLQNDQLKRKQQRTSEYLKKLQVISTAFPSTVQFPKLIEDIYEFTSSIVDVSSIQITLYDRDTRKVYDVLSVNNGEYVITPSMGTIMTEPHDRPLWIKLTQGIKIEQQKTLVLNAPDIEKGTYDELLTGTWGDQRHMQSFLMLPMKMFTRVVGTVSIASSRPHAYHQEEIQVLETMVQIITVSIENAKLYDHTKKVIEDGKKREELLAAMNSALQSISTVLNVAESIQKLVASAAMLIQAEMSVFFQLTPDQNELVAQAIYTPPRVWHDGGETLQVQTRPEELHEELIEKIRVQFKGTILEELTRNSFFYMDQQLAEELAEASDEGGAIFLRETHIERMLMIPVRYQSDLLGVLAVHTPRLNRIFRPKEIGMMLTICSQAASAIRNAQYFEEIQEAYAELQRLDQLKDEFLVTASHELRTPLSAISGYSTLLKRQSNRITPDQIMRFATKIAGSAQQLTDLISNMTEAAKMGAVDKKLGLQIGPVDLSATVEMAVTMLGVNIEQKVETYVLHNLWVRGDSGRVRQVITNLLDNAAKYSASDTRIQIIATETQLGRINIPEEFVDHATLAEYGPDRSVVLVQIKDEGEGVHPEDQQRIFDKFVRAPRSLTTPVRGSGLGLYISRRYIEAMGGRLWLEQSIPGEGSIFTFYLLHESKPIGTGEADEPTEQTW